MSKKVKKTESYPDLIWLNGEFVPWEKAQVHVLTHALHYGSSYFEGIRAYETPEGPTIFRLRDHILRLFNSTKIYSLEIPFSLDEIINACREIISKNGLKSAYIRPLAFIGNVGLGLCPPPDTKAEMMVAAFPWKAYLGEESIKNGIHAMISSWSRLAPNTLPTASKAGGNYLSSQLISREAKKHGYQEGIALNVEGHISEGAGENLFLVQEGTLITPPATASILPGITRDSIMKLAHRLGYKVIEQNIPREALYLADEVFMTGTATEIVPIISIDQIPVSTGQPGSITRELQQAFFGLFSKETEDQWGWLDPV